MPVVLGGLSCLLQALDGRAGRRLGLGNGVGAARVSVAEREAVDLGDGLTAVEVAPGRPPGEASPAYRSRAGLIGARAVGARVIRPE